MAQQETSVAEAHGRAHAALLDDLRKLEEAARMASDIVELRVQLGATKTHLTAHFRFEEEHGYMDAVREQAPRLQHAIERLAAEHRELTESLADLIAQNAATPNVEDRLREQIPAWVKRVRRHEAREDDVVYEAFNRDIGPEDC